MLYSVGGVLPWIILHSSSRVRLQYRPLNPLMLPVLRHLTPLDLAVDDLINPIFLQIHLKVSKTEQVHKEATAVVGRTACVKQQLFSYSGC